ncbi:hypothetical protein [Streptomyces sp. NPDC059850]|uniref:hypothetical protein n=1 Tax=Streptomyces sp. NPDC059850 TaxID=3346970 RepID=UPI00365061D7
MRAGQGLRTVRAAVFAAVCVPLAALGHAMMSGTGVPWWSLTAALVATVAAGWSCAGRERGRVFVTAFTVGAQLALHSFFSLGQTTAGAASSGGGSFARQWAGELLCGPVRAATLTPAEAEHIVRSAGLGHHLAHPPPGTHSMGSMAGTEHADMSSMADGSGVGMIVAHLIAALVCGLWLAYGERAAFRIGRALAARLFAPLLLLIRVAEPPHRPRIRARRHPVAHRPRTLLLAHAITTRGPPHGPAVA